MRNHICCAIPVNHFLHLFVLVCLVAALAVPDVCGTGRRRIGKGPEGGPIEALATDPLAPDTVYVGTYAGGVFKNTNGGGIWTAVNNGLTNTVFYALVIDPLAPDTIYAGTDGGGVFRNLPRPSWDVDADFVSDIAVFRPDSGVWYILPSISPGTYTSIQWGCRRTFLHLEIMMAMGNPTLQYGGREMGSGTSCRAARLAHTRRLSGAPQQT